MSCITRSSLRLSSGCVSWILMLHIGQYLLVCRYFTMQLLQTVEQRWKTVSFSIWRLLRLNLDRFSWIGWKQFTLSETRQQLLRFQFELTCVQTLRYCGGVYEVARTKVADDVFVQVLDLQLDLLLFTQNKTYFKSQRARSFFPIRFSTSETKAIYPQELFCRKTRQEKKKKIK